MDAAALVQMYGGGGNRLLFENSSYPVTNVLVEYSMLPSPDGSSITFNCNYKITVNVPGVYDGISVAAKSFTISTENVDNLDKDTIADYIRQNTGNLTTSAGYTISLGDLLSY